jgi:hypothetical protein
LTAKGINMNTVLNPIKFEDNTHKSLFIASENDLTCRGSYMFEDISDNYGFYDLKKMFEVKG